MEEKVMIQEMLQKAKVAQQAIASYTQQEVDALCQAACLAVKEHAKESAKEVVEETRLGNYEDKVEKISGTADGVWNALRGKKSVDIIKEEPEKGLLHVAKPMGVVVVVAPTTNPNITALCNAAYSIKGRNSCIICSHPRAKVTTKHTVDLMNAAMEAIGGPKDLIQAVEEPSIHITQSMMEQGDIVVATGGMGMVKAAYSSGTPAYGVGAGNVQTVIDEGFEYKEAVEQIVFGRALDNGLICACNQSVIYPAQDQKEIVDLFQKAGAYYVHTPEEIQQIRNTVFIDGKPNGEAVGQTALKVAEMAGIKVPENTKVLLVQGDKNTFGSKELLCGEKMCPVLIALPYDTFEDAIAMAKANLEYIGAGHSASIHSNNQERINAFSIALPVCRILVNQPGVAAANPVGNNGLNVTTSLGCGTWGNNIIDENLTYRHLINVTQVAKVIPDYVPPTQQELYG